MKREAVVKVVQLQVKPMEVGSAQFHGQLRFHRLGRSAVESRIGPRRARARRRRRGHGGRPRGTPPCPPPPRQRSAPPPPPPPLVGTGGWCGGARASRAGPPDGGASCGRRPRRCSGNGGGGSGGGDTPVATMVDGATGSVVALLVPCLAGRLGARAAASGGARRRRWQRWLPPRRCAREKAPHPLSLPLPPPPSTPPPPPTGQTGSAARRHRPPGPPRRRRGWRRRRARVPLTFPAPTRPPLSRFSSAEARHGAWRSRRAGSRDERADGRRDSGGCKARLRPAGEAPAGGGRHRVAAAVERAPPPHRGRTAPLSGGRHRHRVHRRRAAQWQAPRAPARRGRRRARPRRGHRCEPPPPCGPSQSGGGTPSATAPRVDGPRAGGAPPLAWKHQPRVAPPPDDPHTSRRDAMVTIPASFFFSPLLCTRAPVTFAIPGLGCPPSPRHPTVPPQSRALQRFLVCFSDCSLWPRQPSSPAARIAVAAAAAGPAPPLCHQRGRSRGRRCRCEAGEPRCSDVRGACLHFFVVGVVNGAICL